MKKLIALLLFIAMLISLASCGEPAPEPPATDDTPKDEGFEQGYKMEFVLLDEYGSIGIKELAAYADITPDIMAYRSEISSFDRTKIDSINFEIAYGTQHIPDSIYPAYKGLDAYREFQSIPQFEIVLLHHEHIEGGKLKPYLLAEHNEQLIDEKYTYIPSYFGSEEEGEEYGYINEYKSSENVEIPIEFFSGERYGSFTIWARGENELDSNTLVYKYAADIFYLIDGDTVTLCSYYRFLKRVNGTDTTPEEMYEYELSAKSIWGGGDAEGFCRPLTMLANFDMQDAIEFVFSFGWSHSSAYHPTHASKFTEFDCESFNIYSSGLNKIVKEPFGIVKNTYTSANRVLKYSRNYYRNQHLINVLNEKFLSDTIVPFGVGCCEEHNISGGYSSARQMYSIYDNIICFKYFHY